MRFWLTASLAVLAAAAAWAEGDAAFDLTEHPSLLVAPLAAPHDSLIKATIEPTKHELRFDNVFAAERWEQNFQLATKLPLSEALSLRQELRSGIQTRR